MWFYYTALPNCYARKMEKITFSELLKLDNSFTWKKYPNVSNWRLFIIYPLKLWVRYSYLNHHRSIIQGKYFRTDMYAQYIMGWKRYHFGPIPKIWAIIPRDIRMTDDLINIKEQSDCGSQQNVLAAFIKLTLQV